MGISALTHYNVIACRRLDRANPVDYSTISDMLKKRPIMQNIHNCTFINNAVRVLVGNFPSVCQINAWYPISGTKFSSTQAGNNKSSVIHNCGCFYFNFYHRGDKKTLASLGPLPLHSLLNSATKRSNNNFKCPLLQIKNLSKFPRSVLKCTIKFLVTSTPIFYFSLH